MMRSLVLALSLSTMGGAGCSLVLEPIAHHPHDSGVTIDVADFDANGLDALDGPPPDRMHRDAREIETVPPDAIDAPSSDSADAVLSDATDTHSSDVRDVIGPDAIWFDAVSSDATASDVVAYDAIRSDAADTPDPTVDVIIMFRDVGPPPGDGEVPCVTDGDCVPYWCGCGACPSSDVFTCESPTRSCALGCPSFECHYAQNVSCACVGGFCQRSIGMSPAGSSCTASTECAPGLACCACGTSGCPTTCVPADPAGACPLVM